MRKTCRVRRSKAELPRRHCVTHGNHAHKAEAEECVQEVLIAAEAAFEGYRGEGSVRAFLFGIARRMRLA